MGYLKYKGYTGSVEYSEEDKCLFGKHSNNELQEVSRDHSSRKVKGQTIKVLSNGRKGERHNERRIHWKQWLPAEG